MATACQAIEVIAVGHQVCKMTLADEQKSLAVEAQAAAAKQGDTVRSLKASLKDGKAEKASSTSTICSAVLAQSLSLAFVNILI